MYKKLEVLKKWGDVEYQNYEKNIKRVLMSIEYMIIIKKIERVDEDDWKIDRYV